MHFSKLIQYTVQGVNHYENYVLHLIIMYQYCFIKCNEHTTLMTNINNRGKGVGGDSVLSAQFLVN